MSNRRKENYKQCLLQRKNERQMSFIPEEAAKIWKVVDLKEGDEWDKNWQVIEVYEPAIPFKDVELAANQARNTRKASDI